MAEIIDGKAVSLSIKEEIRVKIEKLNSKKINLSLATILVGDDPSSQIYIRNKMKSCKEVGIESVHISMPSNITEDELLQKIEELNRDDKIDGILVQLPLPVHINEQKVINAISFEKDVDGFHPYNQGRLLSAKNYKTLIDESVPIPCTPFGCIKLLEHYNIPTISKRSVIIGRSNIVGKPLAILLLLMNATVSIVHSKTENLSSYTKEADIIVCATGKREILKGDMVKNGVVVLDVGINRADDGKIYGDADFDSVSRKASYITPVPGGVGPMTITMLLFNTLRLGVKRRGVAEI